MKFAKRGTPGQQELALGVDNGFEWLHQFAELLGSHHIFWEGEQTRAARRSNPMGVKLAKDLAGKFSEAGQPLRALYVGRYPGNPEIVKRLALGTLAVSRLLRGAILPSGTAPEVIATTAATPVFDGLEAGRADLMPDMDSDDTGMPLKFRVHLPISVTNDREVFEPGGQRKQWYYGNDDEGGLWVRLAPADPSPGLRDYLRATGVRVDFTQLRTAFPYVAVPQNLSAFQVR